MAKRGKFRSVALLTREIDRLTIELHKRVVGATAAVGGEGPAQAAPSPAGDG